jgi:hypothetical protein
VNDALFASLEVKKLLSALDVVDNNVMIIVMVNTSHISLAWTD